MGNRKHRTFDYLEQERRAQEAVQIRAGLLELQEELRAMSEYSMFLLKTLNRRFPKHTGFKSLLRAIDRDLGLHARHAIDLDHKYSQWLANYEHENGPVEPVRMPRFAHFPYSIYAALDDDRREELEETFWNE